MFKKLRNKFLIASVATVVGLTNLNAQLNSVDGYGGIHNFLNNFYTDKQPMGWSAGARYNLDVSWEFGAVLGVGVSNSKFNLATSKNALGVGVPETVSHTYTDLSLALEWQWMTEIRTRMQGGPTNARGSKDIMFANFKSYLLGGADYKIAMGAPTEYSSKSVLNVFGGIGFEWYRFGKNAHHGSNAIVPFTEVLYYKNVSNYYAKDAKGVVIKLDAYYIRFGVKYTFGFSQKKFSW